MPIRSISASSLALTKAVRDEDHRFRPGRASELPQLGNEADGSATNLERARRIERPTLTLARLCSTPELRPQSKLGGGYGPARVRIQAALRIGVKGVLRPATGDDLL